MKRFLIGWGALGCFMSTQAQHAPKKDTSITTLEEVVVSANNFGEKRRNLAQKIDVITAQTIARVNAPNSGDLLIQTGKVFVQKSQQGGSSPVIRGFEASRVLLVVDGIRMNNAIYRSGHLQNIITADQNMVQQVEVLYGPSSAIYGSDALGGAVHFITQKPVLGNGKTVQRSGSAFARFNNVNDEATVHARLNLGGKKLAWLQSYTFSNFGDMRMGNRYPAAYPNFGRRSTYIDQINGRDTVLQNPDDRMQKFSGYSQWDILQKVLFKPSSRFSHLLNLQLSNSTNVPRYDRLQDVRNGNLRFAEWYYGPQKRILTAYEFQALQLGWADELKVTVSYQDIEESRITREFRRYDRFDRRVEQVRVWGATVTARKHIGNHELTTGLDMQHNHVRSRASRTNQLTGAIAPLDTRYPDGKNTMATLAAFAQHVFKFSGGKWVLNDGIRVQHTRLRSNILNNTFFRLPDTAVTQNNLSVTGNLGIVYHPNQKTTIRLNASSGFRAPNIDDLAKVFESSTALRQVVLPNANLKPEYTYNVDAGIAQQWGSFSYEVTAFYTWFRNALVKAPFRLNGQDSIVYDGVRSQILASQNANKAFLYGFTASAQWKFAPGWEVQSTLSYTRGRFVTDPSQPSSIYEKQPDGTYAIVRRNVSSRPLDHIPPVFGRTGLSYTAKRWQVEAFSLYNGWKRLEDFNTEGEDNPQYATPDGMPGWIIYNLRGSWQISKVLELQVALENLLDRNYRYFSSGFSAGGRGFLCTIRARW